MPLVEIAFTNLRVASDEPGWAPVRREGEPDTADIRCPGCRKIAGLRNHTIDAEGVVSPSVVCAHEGCDFHQYVKLAGWETRSALDEGVWIS